MIKTAQAIFDINLVETYFIGESIIDINTAKKSGLTPILLSDKTKEPTKDIKCFESLFEASQCICRK